MSTFNESVSGYVQCESHVFRVKNHHVVLLKVAEKKNCFCQPCTHILVRWNDATESKDEKLARMAFIRACSAGCTVQVDGLKKSVIYKGQQREHPVLLFSAQHTKVNKLPEIEPCHPVRCPSWPLGLIPILACRIITVNKNGTLLHVSTTGHEKATSNFLCLYCVASKNRSLFPGRSLILRNVWGVPVPVQKHPFITTPGENKLSGSIEGIIVIGMYSTCSTYCVLQPIDHQLPHSSLTFSIDSLSTKSFVDVPLLIKCFTVARIYETLGQSEQPNALMTKETGWLDPERLLAFIQVSECGPQYAEELITFPRLFSHPTLPSPDYYEDIHWVTLSELTKISQVAISSPDSPTHLKISLPDRCSQLIGMVTAHSRLSNNCVWCSRLVELRLTTDHIPEWQQQRPYWCVESMNATHQPRATVPKKCALVGRLLWDPVEGCFQLTQPRASAVNVLLPVPEQADRISTVSIPVVFPRFYHSGFTFPPLPSDETMVALLDWQLISESILSRDPTQTILSKQFIVAAGCVALELDLGPEQGTSSYPFSMTAPQTIQLTSLGSPLRSNRSEFNGTFGYPIQYRTSTENTFGSMLLSGPIALQWYSRFQTGTVYQLHTRELNEHEYELLYAVPVSTKVTDSSLCGHMLSPSQALALIRRPEFALESTHTAFNLRGVVISKFHTLDGWYLWLVDEPFHRSSSGDNWDVINPESVLQIHLPFEDPWLHSLCSPWPFACIRVYTVHASRSTGMSGEPFRLVSSSLSRVEIELGTDHFSQSCSSTPPTVTVQQQSCSQCIQILQMITTVQPQRPLSWLASVAYDEESLADGIIRVRGNIVRCLEFVYYRTDMETNSTDPISKCLQPNIPTFGISLRFVISDGSASALVLFGQRHLGGSVSESNELARLLFGLPQTVWTRLCTQLQRTVEQVKTASSSAPTGQLYLKFSQESRSSTPLNPLEFALYTYLTSASFLRPHVFRMRRTYSRNTTYPWRLKEVHLTGTNAVGETVRPEKVHFVLPPFPTYTLIGLESY